MKGLLSKTELEYRTPQQVSMTLEEIRGSQGITARYTVVSATRGDLWDFTSRAEATNFAAKMDLEDRKNGTWEEGRYTIRDNGMSRAEFNAICDKWGLSLDMLAKILNRSKECIRSYRYREGDALPAEVASKVHSLDEDLTLLREINPDNILKHLQQRQGMTTITHKPEDIHIADFYIIDEPWHTKNEGLWKTEHGEYYLLLEEEKHGPSLEPEVRPISREYAIDWLKNHSDAVILEPKEANELTEV